MPELGLDGMLKVSETRRELTYRSNSSGFMLMSEAFMSRMNEATE